jgi:hypothetical protein
MMEQHSSISKKRKLELKVLHRVMLKEAMVMPTLMMIAMKMMMMLHKRNSV